MGLSKVVSESYRQRMQSQIDMLKHENDELRKKITQHESPDIVRSLKIFQATTAILMSRQNTDTLTISKQEFDQVVQGKDFLFEIYVPSRHEVELGHTDEMILTIVDDSATQTAD